MVDVYVCSGVQQVSDLHKEMLRAYPGRFLVINVLERQAETLLKAYEQSNPVVCIQLSNWLKDCIGRSPEAILGMGLGLQDMRLCVAHEHGYPNWEVATARGDLPLDPEFEMAVDAVVHGRIEALGEMVEGNPGLVHRASNYGHEAMLLHYVAANGVETWRQMVPSNAAAIARLLIERGADRNARMRVYGGHHTTLELLLTSAHPAEAGVTDEVAAVLRGSPLA